MTTPAPSIKLGYRSELDGVRGFAVLIILLYHLSFLLSWIRPPVRGAIFSVNLFFVLSGLLITEILLADAADARGPRLGLFFRRRARRLGPGLIGFLVFAVAVNAIFESRGLYQLRGLGSVVSYVVIGHFTAPFPNGTSQVWTVVAEWEFYLTWPFILVALLRFRVPTKVIGYLAVAGVVAASAARILLWRHDGGNFILNYHLGVLRFQDTLAGCAAALLGATYRPSNALRTLAVGVLIFLTIAGSTGAKWCYYYGLAAAAVSVAIIIAARDRPWWFDRVLASRMMVWLGTISYSLYLYSVFAISEISGHFRSVPPTIRGLAAVIVSFALATLSYYQIEHRFRARSRRLPSTAGLSAPS